MQALSYPAIDGAASSATDVQLREAPGKTRNCPQLPFYDAARRLMQVRRLAERH